jgi:hypothetical protein
MKINIIQTILTITSNAQASVLGDDINTLVWHDNNPTNITNQQILDKQQELQALENVYDNRRKEYPDFRDYLDGIVKGDNAQVQKYINDCLAVKAKYPKPSATTINTNSTTVA